MINIIIEYSRSTLFVKLKNNKLISFVSELVPIIFEVNSKYLVIDLKDIELCDRFFASSVIRLSSLISVFDGKVILHSMNDDVYFCLKENDVFDYCFKANNNKHSMDVINI